MALVKERILGLLGRRNLVLVGIFIVLVSSVLIGKAYRNKTTRFKKDISGYSVINFKVKQKLDDHIYRISLNGQYPIIPTGSALLQTVDTQFDDPNTTHTMFVAVGREKRGVKLANGFTDELPFYYETPVDEVPGLIEKFHSKHDIKQRFGDSWSVVDAWVVEDQNRLSFHGVLRNNARTFHGAGVYFTVYTDESKSEVLTTLHSILLTVGPYIHKSEMAVFGPNPFGDYVPGRFVNKDGLYTAEDFKHFDVTIFSYRDNRELTYALRNNKF